MIVWTPLCEVTYTETAAHLRTRDLLEARVSALRVLAAMRDGDADGVPHIWRGFGPALVAYIIALDDEWEARGHRRTAAPRALKIAAGLIAGGVTEESIEGTAHEDVLRMMGMLPPDDALQRNADRRELLSRDPAWYGRWQWTQVPGRMVPDDHPRDELAERRARKGEKERHTMATRTALVESLRERGYEGPVSYTKSRLEEMVTTLESGGTIEAPKRGRKPREAESPNGDAQEGD